MAKKPTVASISKLVDQNTDSLEVLGESIVKLTEMCAASTPAEKSGVLLSEDIRDLIEVEVHRRVRAIAPDVENVALRLEALEKGEEIIDGV